MSKRYTIGFDSFDAAGGDCVALHDDICVKINEWLEQNPKAKLIDVKYQALHVGKDKDWEELEGAGLDSYLVVYSAVIIVEEE